MEANYVGKLILGILIFAPGLVLLVGALFVGALMLLEKWGVFDALVQRRRHSVVERELPAGPIVGRLKEAIEASRAAEPAEPEEPAEKAQKRADRATS